MIKSRINLYKNRKFEVFSLLSKQRIDVLRKTIRINIARWFLDCENIFERVCSILRINQPNRSNWFSTFFRPKAREYVVWYNPLRLFVSPSAKFQTRRTFVAATCTRSANRDIFEDIKSFRKKISGKTTIYFLSLHPYRVTLLLSLKFVSFLTPMH